MGRNCKLKSRRDYFLFYGDDEKKPLIFAKFCRDAIFQIQHTSGLMATDDGQRNINKELSYSSCRSEEDGDRNPFLILIHVSSFN